MNDTSSTQPAPADADTGPASARTIARDSSGRVRLVPDLPPGRCTRKVLPFADEVRRLYEAGYTLEAIRRALSAVGVTVSRSTVHREVTRATRKPRAGASTDAAHFDVDRAPSPATVEANGRLHGGGESVSPRPLPSPGGVGQGGFAEGPRGEDVAKAFMSTQITNPFMRQKEQR